jgi:hypothetical protein
MLRMLATICLGLHLATLTTAGPDDVPIDLEKWIEVDPPEELSPRWLAANGDRHEWVVTLRDDHPRVHLRDRKAEVPTPLPFEIKPGSSREGLRGNRTSIKVDDGWIVAFNSGEFGAGLWWFSPDGKEREKLAEAWVRGFIPTDKGPLAVEGIAHGFSSTGRILRLARVRGGRWRSEDFVDLGHAPSGYVKDADGSLLVATTERLLRVAPSTGKVEVILDEVCWSDMYPNSMVVTRSGTVYLGMRHAVVRVDKKGKSWQLHWLVPNKEFDEVKPE